MYNKKLIVLIIATLLLLTIVCDAKKHHKDKKDKKDRDNDEYHKDRRHIDHRDIQRDHKPTYNKKFYENQRKTQTTNINNRPIIGIYTQPTDGGMAAYGDQYIAASYVKFLESGGSRVVPILYDTPEEELVELFNSINGLFLPGGGVDLGESPEYTSNLKLLYELVIAANDKGDYFPLWGTCMGFQELAMLQANDLNILDQYDSENYTVPINMTSAAASSRLFSMASPTIMQSLATLPITMNNHMYGLSPATFQATSLLNTFFDVLSTNVDRNGNTFISTYEAKNYPIYGTQWHPEKVIFEWWDQEVMNHSFLSVMANQYTSNFFVNECRKNLHSFPSQASENAALIYNYLPNYSFDYVQDFEQTYYFNNQSSSSSSFAIGF